MEFMWFECLIASTLKKCSMKFNLAVTIENIYSEFLKNSKQASFNSLPIIDKHIHLYLNEEVFPRAVKDRSDILREYEDEKWGGLLAHLNSNQNFSHSNVMRAFYGSDEIAMFFNHCIFQASILDYHWLVTELLSNVFHQLSENQPIELFEFGCGFGGTLIGTAIKLERTSQLSCVFGTDISASGMEILTKLSEAEGIPVRTNIFDFGSNQKVPKIPVGLNSVRFAFTHFSLAAQTEYTDNPIETILRNSEADYIVICEPIVSDVIPATFSSHFTRNHIKHNSYNNRIKIYVDELVSKGLGEIIANSDDIIGASIATAISIYVIDTKCS